MYICPICEKDPTSHSLKNLGMKNGKVYFYTCPAKATKYNDTEGIINHYSGVLSENKEKWVWVFDSKGFSTSHLLCINVGIELAKLISEKHSHNLEKIVVINPTWHVKTVLSILTPFLKESVRQMIKIKYPTQPQTKPTQISVDEN